MISRLKKILAIEYSESLWTSFRNYLRFILFWIPLCSLIYLALVPNEHLGINFSVFLIIGITCNTIVQWGSIGIKMLLSILSKDRFSERNIIIDIGLGIVLTWPALYLGFQFSNLFLEMNGYKPFLPELQNYSQSFVYGLLILLFVMGYEELIKYRRKNEAMQFRLKDIENKNLKVQLSTLSSQLNPHFLFNSLNTIASMIHEDPDVAEDMVVRLADFYRATLATFDKSFHSLKHELDLLHLYLSIEKSRFGERVQFSFNIEDSLDQETIIVPVLLLQPLIENSMIHGISPKIDGGNIAITIAAQANKLHIRIADTGLGSKAKPSKGTGLGHDHCVRRLDFLYSKQAQFHFSRDSTGAIVEIILPVKDKSDELPHYR